MCTNRLNEFEIKTTGNVFKYQKASVAVSCLTKGNLQFSRPSNWKDPTEKAFYDAKILPEGVIDASKVYACCISKNPLSEAAWITYQYGTSDGAVKFSIKFNKLLQQIDKWARANNFDFYYGAVIYDEWNVINKIGKRDFKYKSAIFKHGMDTMESFLRSLLLKRKAFEYENEIRLFLVNNGDERGDSFLVEINWDECLNKIYYSEDCKCVTVKQLQNSARAINKKTQESSIYHKKEPVEYNIYYNENNPF